MSRLKMCCAAAIVVGLISMSTGCRSLPQHATAQKHAGVSGPVLGDTTKADPSITRASLDLTPTSGSSILLHLDLAKALDSQGQLEKANEEYQRALTAARSENLRAGTHAQQARIHRRLAAACERLGQPREAQTHLHEAQKLDPNNPDVWNDIGYSAYLEGKWSEAEKAFRKALSLDRANQRATTNLGLTLAASGRVDEGYQSLRSTSGAAAAHVNVAYILASQGNTDEARSHYEAALGENPSLQVAKRGLDALRRANDVEPPTPAPAPSNTGSVVRH